MPSSRQLNPQDAEQLRQAALEALALRHPVAMSARAVARAADRDLAFEVAESAVDSALEFLRDKGFVKFEFEQLGSTKWWSITAEGLQAVERGI